MTEQNKRKRTKDKCSDSDFDKARFSGRHSMPKSGNIKKPAQERKSFSLFTIRRPCEKQKKLDDLDKSSMPRFNELLLNKNAKYYQSTSDTNIYKQKVKNYKTTNIMTNADEHDESPEHPLLRHSCHNLKYSETYVDTTRRRNDKSSERVTDAEISSDAPLTDGINHHNHENDTKNNDESDENYRKSSFLEIDNCLEQMKLDCFLSENTTMSEDNDDFETHILDETGENYIVEAYNDIGNELVITFLEITRKSLSVDRDFSLEKALKSDDKLVDIDDKTSVVLHKQEDEHIYQELVNYNENIPTYARTCSSYSKKEKLNQFASSNQSSFDREIHHEVIDDEVKSEPLYSNLEDQTPETPSYNVKNMISLFEAPSRPSGAGPDEVENEAFEVNDSRSDIDECLSKRTSGYESSSQENQEVGNFVENVIDEEAIPVRRSTVCDNSGNVRIEKISRIPAEQYTSTTIVRTPSDPKRSSKRKVDYVIEELIQSEAKYLSDLEKIVRDYKPYIERVGERHRSLSGKATYIFGNIETIYSHAQKFNEVLKRCRTIDDVAWTFIKFKHMFELYPLYSMNKPKSELYMKEFHRFIKDRQQRLGDRLGLSSYLLTPIQRLGKYILLLEKLEKYTENSGIEDSSEVNCISKALSMIRNEMRKGNDCIAIESIRKCPIDLTLEGSFLMREKFLILKPRKFESMVFLFEKIIVFTVVDQDDVESFIYQDSIYLLDLSILINETHPTIFHLIDFPKNKILASNEYTFILEAKTRKIKELWTQQIENLLWTQLKQYKDQIMQLQNNELGKRTQRGIASGKQNAASSMKKVKKHIKRSKFYDTM